MPKKKVNVKRKEFTATPVRPIALTMPAMPAVKQFDNYDEWYTGGEQLAKFGELLKRTGAQYQIFVGEWYKGGLANEAKWRKDNLASRDQKAISVERAAQDLGFDKETIANWGWVASNTKQLRDSLKDDGRGLTFEDLRAVAAFESPKQQREWIDRKCENDWSASELRRQVMQARGKAVSPRNDAEREQARELSATVLIEQWIFDGNAFIAQGDPASLELADLCYDHADKLKRALKL